MSAIFGIFNRNGEPAGADTLEKMGRAFASWPSERVRYWVDGPVGLGQLLTFNTPEARNENLSRLNEAGSVAFTAAARVDNRQELFDLLSVASEERRTMPDGDLLLKAYERWGAETPNHIYGDWVFGAWHPNERKLFLARDHHGHGGLYYFSSPSVFAFASSRKALLALNLAPVAMDELYLAQVLVSWPAYHGERTFHQGIYRLPPSHWLAVTPEQEETRRYWYLENTPELKLSSRQEYVEGFRAVFDEAVRARLRSDTAVGVTLSGGLDSGAVSATAALMLRQDGKRLAAFTSVPKWDTTAFLGERFGDELPFARATVEFAGNIDHFLVHGDTLSPLEAIRLSLDIHDEPGHAAGNAFWMNELFGMARQHGVGALLTGQLGNASVSWTGDMRLQQRTRTRAQLWGLALRGAVRRALPPAARARYRAWRNGGRDFPYSAIRTDFARRLRLRERLMTETREDASLSPREQRYEILRPGRLLLGCLYAEISGAYGLEVRDPTGDTRVLEYMIAVPDPIFRDPETGLNRWLIRAGMEGRLPDEVRLNSRRGRQAGDLVQRLRGERAAVEASLDELARGQAADYIDVPFLRESWQLIQSSDTPQAYHNATTVFTRGIMGGMAVNRMAASEPTT